MEVMRCQLNEYSKKDDSFEHIIEYEKLFGKPPSGWVIHHINCLKYDNSGENLIALPVKFHNWLHGYHNPHLRRFYREYSRKGAMKKKHIQVILDMYLKNTISLNKPFKKIISMVFELETISL